MVNETKRSFKPRMSPHGRKDPPRQHDTAGGLQTAPSGNSAREFVDECLQVLLELFRLYGFEAKGYKLGPTRVHWMRLLTISGGTEAAAVQLVKYKLAAFAASQLQQEVLPRRPFPDAVIDNPMVLLGGRAHRYARLVLSGRTEHNPYGFIASALYSKKGMPRPSKRLVESAEMKAVEALTTPRLDEAPVRPVYQQRWADIPSDEEDPHPHDLVIDRAVVTRELRRTVREIWSGARSFGLQDRIAPLFPSTSANYNRSRSELGAVGELLSHTGLFMGLRSKDGLLRVRRKYDEEAIGASNEPTLEIDATDLEATAGILYDRVIVAALKEVPHVEPVGLAEPLKVRVISKGPPLTYYVLKALQRYMWGVLQTHPVFALTGLPVGEEILTASLGELRAGEKWESADFESATDKLHSWVSEAIADEIATQASLSEEERVLFIRSLTQHIFLMPDGTERPQRTGQLMGSITSFPVLCVANAAMCRYGLEATRRQVLTLRECPLLVNGDDAAFPTTPWGRHVWSTSSTVAGLIPSVGKCYSSPEFVNINSTFFRFTPNDLEFKDRKFKLIHYVNLGLLHGQQRAVSVGTKKGTVLNADTGRTIGSRSRDLWRCCPPCLRPQVSRAFILRNLETLKEVNLPWGVPEHLGGLGVAGASVNETDIRLARAIVADNVAVPAVTAAKVWLTRQLAVEQLPRGSTQSRLSDDESERYERWLGLLGVDLLFRSDPGLPSNDTSMEWLVHRIYQKAQESRSLGAQYRPLTNLWRRRMKNGAFAPSSLVTTTTVDGDAVRMASFVDYDSEDPESGLPGFMRTKRIVHEGVRVREVQSLRGVYRSGYGYGAPSALQISASVLQRSRRVEPHGETTNQLSLAQAPAVMKVSESTEHKVEHARPEVSSEAYESKRQASNPALVVRREALSYYAGRVGIGL